MRDLETTDSSGAGNRFERGRTRRIPRLVRFDSKCQRGLPRHVRPAVLRRRLPGTRLRSLRRDRRDGQNSGFYYAVSADVVELARHGRADARQNGGKETNWTESPTGDDGKPERSRRAGAKTVAIDEMLLKIVNLGQIIVNGVPRIIEKHRYIDCEFSNVCPYCPCLAPFYDRIFTGERYT